MAVSFIGGGRKRLTCRKSLTNLAWKLKWRYIYQIRSLTQCIDKLDLYSGFKANPCYRVLDNYWESLQSRCSYIFLKMRNTYIKNYFYTSLKTCPSYYVLTLSVWRTICNITYCHRQSEELFVILHIVNVRSKVLFVILRVDIVSLKNYNVFVMLCCFVWSDWLLSCLVVNSQREILYT